MLNRRSFLTGSTSMGAAIAFSRSSCAENSTSTKGPGYRHSLYFSFKDDVPFSQHEAYAGKIFKTSEMPGVMNAVMRRNRKTSPGDSKPHTYFQWVIDQDFVDKKEYDNHRARPEVRAIMREDFLPYTSEYLVGDANQPFYIESPDPRLANAKVSYRHHVMFNLRKEAPDEQRKRLIHSIQTIVARQSTVKSFLIGENCAPADNYFRYEWVCAADFISEADHEAYQKDPVHLEQTQRDFVPLALEVLSIDTFL